MNPWQSAADSYQQGLQGLGQVQQGAYREMANAPLKLYQMFMEGYEKANERKRLEQLDKLKQQQYERQMSLAEETVRHNKETEEYGRQRLREQDRQKAQAEAIDAFMNYNARVGGNDSLVKELFKRAGFPETQLPQLETAEGAGRELPGPVRPGEEPLRVEGENPLSGYGPAALAKATEQHRKEQADKERAIRDAKANMVAQGRLEDAQRRTANAAEASARAAGLAASRGEVKESDGKYVVVNPFTGRVTEAVGPDGKPIAAKSNLKPIPASRHQAIMNNEMTLRKIDEAIGLLEKNKGAVGPTKSTLVRSLGGGTYGTLQDKGDPGGVATRQALQEITNLTLHDLSGAAVTLSEDQRFQSVLPQIGQYAEPNLVKLKRLRALAAGTNDMYKEAYSEANGYRPLSLGGGNPGSDGPKKGDVEKGYRFKGGDPKDPKNWEKV